MQIQVNEILSPTSGRDSPKQKHRPPKRLHSNGDGQEEQPSKLHHQGSSEATDHQAAAPPTLVPPPEVVSATL